MAISYVAVGGFDSHFRHGGHVKKAIYVFLFLVLILLPTNAGIGDIKLEMIQSPGIRFTDSWTFIIDGSVSLWFTELQTKCRLLKKSEKAFRYATSFPTDSMKFNVFLFAGDSLTERHAYRDWATGLPDEFKATRKWMSDNIGGIGGRLGLYSHGIESIRLSLYQKQKNLTILWITDGGFTSACYTGDYSKIDKVIAEGQAWRLLNGYSKAIIVTIGIENRHYLAGGKPSDKICQAYLRKIGTENLGGYWYVSSEHAK